MTKKLTFAFAALLFSLTQIIAQISAPEVQAVYGGRILDITGYHVSSHESRIFISTESANSAFYADVNSSSGTPVYSNFKVLNALKASAGWGAQIQKIGVEEHSGAFVFVSNGLHYTDPSYSTITTAYSGNVEDFIIAGSKIFFTSGPSLHFGTFDSAGKYTEDAGSPIPMGSPGGNVTINLHPTSKHLYFFYEGASQFYKTTHPYTSISGGTTFSALPISAGSTPWRTMGIAPDGRLFLGGSNGGSKKIAYSDDEINWTTMTTMGGVAGSNFAFGGDSTSYHVYFASTFSNNRGASGTWDSFGMNGFETHPNDGAVFADPTDHDVVYMTTDQGIGSSSDKGATIYEINDGVEAVQVKDMDMEGTKNTAWFASKSGIRKVSNYQSTPSWTNAIFPNGDGSPYFTAEMNMSNNNIVYVGNARVYKTTDDGLTWHQVFTAEHAPYNFPNVGSEVRAIEISNDDPNIVMAGYNLQGSGLGGLFVTEDGGTTWDQILIDAATYGQDIDIHDIELTMEGSDIVAYVGVEYEMSVGYSVYKITKTSSGWSVAQDMSGSNTSTGSVIVVTIKDLEVSSTGDTIFATGTDVGVNHPVAYFKDLSGSGLWTPFTVSGFPVVSGKKGYAITLGVDTVYCAVDNEIYYLPLAETSWKLGYAYPNGTEINFLYFDDLLAGTGTGLYEHPSDGSVSTSVKELLEKPSLNLLSVSPNPVSDKSNITFTIPQKHFTEIVLYDAFGKIVQVLESGMKNEGTYEVEFDASKLPNGIYYCSLKYGEYVETKRLVKVD